MTYPAIPSLVLIPDESQADYAALCTIANAYAHSGLLLSRQGKEEGRVELSLPAVVCSSFAIELFLKFFLMLEGAEDDKPSPRHEHEQRLGQLWGKISVRHQALVAGMFRNDTGTPSLTASDLRIEMFEEALKHVGDKPFDKWRYAHEITDPTLMSHAAIHEVVGALSLAANYAMNEALLACQDDASQPDDVPIEQSIPEQIVQPDDEELLLVNGSERLLLGRDSVLRRIPVNVDPKQALFLDGIRHAVEIMDIAYSRLRDALTQLAQSPPAPNVLPDLSASVFLDAWSFVDAIDRFRILYSQMPGMKKRAAKRNIPPLDEATRDFRDLRNVADHLAQRADFVISRNGAALGELAWLTGAQLEPKVIAWHCMLRPGTLRSTSPTRTTTIVSTLDWPTDAIRLSAAGYEGNLSAVRKHIAVRVRLLEGELKRIFDQPIQAQVPILNDMFSRHPVKIILPTP